MAVLSLDFIHNKKYLLWMDTADFKKKMDFSCGCGATGKVQISNQWFAVVVAVPQLERVKFQTNG